MGPLTRAYRSPPLSASRLRWTLAALLLASLPLVNDLPLWIFALLALTCVWRYIAFIRHHTPPHPALRFFWSIANFAFVWSYFNTINGLEPGSALLLVMCAMKLTETNANRDLIVIIYMALFLIMAHALFDQSIPATISAAVITLFVITALIQVSRRTAPQATRPALGMSAMLLAQALPVLLLLFVLFPRVPGPFWALPRANSAATGLSNSMEPGSISSLLQSGSVAFRVEFDGNAPPANTMYWRGPVFSTIVDRTWTTGTDSSQSASIDIGGDAVNYSVTLEPHQQKWLFALDAPDPRSIPAFAKLTPQMQLQGRTAIKQRMHYSLASHTRYRLDVAGLGHERRVYLDTSRVDNPRTRALAERWRDDTGDAEQIVNAALAYFNQQPFSYTLRPPLLPVKGASDAFLFDSRAGFCEHYSSSFALLMRYAGIPTRVVTGYQGGEANDFASHYTVRQSDAHAWNEVWLENRGWVRVDPTAAVAPERVDRGIRSALRGESLGPMLLGNGLLLSRLRHSWDAINAAWNERVLGFGKRAQFDLLRKLGIKSPDAAKMTALLSVSMIGFLLLLGAFLRWRAQRSRDPLVRIYDRFCARMARQKLMREDSEGPFDFAARAGRALPQRRAAIDAFTRLYVARRYGPPAAGDALGELRTLLKKI